jgi:hypothetical protein
MTILFVSQTAPPGTPDTFSTIQAAVDASSPGDTIIVSPGLYMEQVTISTPNLTLQGAEFNVDARLRSTTPDPLTDSIILFNPSAGSGIININTRDITINGFTIQSVSPFVGGSAAILALSGSGSSPNNISGLNILNNIIENSGDGINLQSNALTPQGKSYLIQQNVFLNNARDIFISNNMNISIRNIVIDKNNFNDARFVAIFLSNTSQVAITNNNISSNSPQFSGIYLYSSNDRVNINGNCITSARRNGIIVQNNTAPNSNVTINRNNIQGNNIGIRLDVGSYIVPPALDATNNYYGSSDGPNYNNTGPGSGDFIVDQNDIPTPSIIYIPFSPTPFVCSSPLVVVPVTGTVTLNKTSSGINTTPVSFTVSLIVTANSPPITSFTDTLPPLPSGNKYFISSESPSGFFTLSGTNPQNLVFTTPFPITLLPNTYSVTVTAYTSSMDAGALLVNTAMLTFADPTLNQTVTALASVSALSILSFCDFVFTYPKQRECLFNRRRRSSSHCRIDSY